MNNEMYVILIIAFILGFVLSGVLSSNLIEGHLAYNVKDILECRKTGADCKNCLYSKGRTTGIQLICRGSGTGTIQGIPEDEHKTGGYIHNDIPAGPSGHNRRHNRRRNRRNRRNN